MTSIALFGQPAAIDTAQDTLEQQAHTTGEAIETLTPAQLEAGNFKQGHIKLFGMDFTIRTPRGHYGDYLALFGTKSTACKISPYTHVAYPTTHSIRQGSLYGQFDPVPVLFGLRRDMDTVFVVSVGLSDRPDVGKRWVLVIGADDAADARSITYMVLQDSVRNPAAIGADGERGYWYLHESLELEPTLLKSWLNDGLPNPEHLLKSENLLANLFAYQQGLPIDTAWQHDPERTANNARYLAFAYDDVGQMTEALALDEAQDMTEGEGVSGVAMDALATPYKRLEQVLNRLLLPAMRSVAGDLQITDNVQMTQPKRLAGVLQTAALITLSDGQTITIWFHNIDATPSKLSPDDPMTAWKWLLNKKNITVLVAPEGGKDLSIREIATRIMRMANKNSSSFLKAQSKRTNLEQQLTTLDDQILNGQQVLSDLDAEITELEQKETDQVQPEPETTTAASTTEQLNQQAFDGVKNALSSAHGWSSRGNALLEKSFSGAQGAGDLNPDGSVIVSIRPAGPLIIASIGNGMSDPITIGSEFLPQYSQNDAAYQATATALNTKVEAYVEQKRSELQPASDPAGSTSTPDSEFLQSVIDGRVDPLTLDMPHMIELAEKYQDDPAMVTLVEAALTVVGDAQLAADQAQGAAA